jgi:hypothetical protein
VPGGRDGGVEDAKSLIPQPFTEIHILKPDRVKLFVEAADGEPGRAFYHEKRPGGLVDFSDIRRVEPDAIATIYRVPGEEPVDSEELENQRKGRRETSHVEAVLLMAITPDEGTGCGGYIEIGEGSFQFRKPAEDHGVRIQEKNRISLETGKSLIGCRGEPPVGGIRDQPDS